MGRREALFQWGSLLDWASQKLEWLAKLAIGGQPLSRQGREAQVAIDRVAKAGKDEGDRQAVARFSGRISETVAGFAAYLTSER